MMPPDLLQVYSDITTLKAALNSLTAAEIAQDLVDLHALMEHIRSTDGTVEEFMRRTDRSKGHDRQ